MNTSIHPEQTFATFAMFTTCWWDKNLQREHRSIDVHEVHAMFAGQVVGRQEVVNVANIVNVCRGVRS